MQVPSLLISAEIEKLEHPQVSETLFPNHNIKYSDAHHFTSNQ